MEVQFLGYRQPARTRTSSENSGVDLDVLSISPPSKPPSVLKPGTSPTASLGLGMAQILTNVRKEAREEAAASARKMDNTAMEESDDDSHAKRVWNIEHLKVLEDTARAQRLAVERKVSGRDFRSKWEIK